MAVFPNRVLLLGGIVMGEQYCYTCGNQGFVDRECPECHRPPTRDSLNVKTEQQAVMFEKKLEQFMIPQQYHGVLWSRDIMEDTHKELLGQKFGISDSLNDTSFIRYLDNLEKIYTKFSEDGIVNKSFIIVAPVGFSKMIFAYSCMQKAIEKGFKVAPLLDTIELKRLLTIAGETLNYKLYNKITYDQYIMSDVVFVTITRLPARAYAFQVMQELIDKRARLGLPTFFISRYLLSEIASLDASGAFTYQGRRRDDFVKCPTVIKYTKGLTV